MPRIFISYRRNDSATGAGRIYDRLEGHFGRGQVFRDVDTIRPGARGSREESGWRAVVGVLARFGRRGVEGDIDLRGYEQED